MIRIDIATLFPEMCEAVLSTSIIGRARKAGKVELYCHNIRDYSPDPKHHRVDDTPYGGGKGMVMQPEPIYRCYLDIIRQSQSVPHVIYLSPQGSVLTEQKSLELREYPHLLLLCGHYEGVDERILERIVDEEISIGDYVLKEEIRRYVSQEENALTLIVDNTDHLLLQLEENQLDFALIEGYFDRDRFDSRLFRREPFVGICPKNHSFAGREVGLEELLEKTIIHREEGSGTRAILEQKLQGYNESLERFRRHICISSFKVILDLVRAGCGVSFVYEVLANSDPGLARFTIRGEPIVREFNIVYLKYADLQEKFDWFFGENTLPGGGYERER